MPSMVVVPNLSTEKALRRLLVSTETSVERNSIDDWKLDQFVKTLTEMLNDMRKSMNRPSSKQLDEYKRRIDALRDNIDLNKLEDQTFPRQKSEQNSAIDISIKEQPNETKPDSTSSTDAERNSLVSNKSDRPTVNRQQQYIQTEEDRQDTIAEAMRVTTKSILNNAIRLNEVAKQDHKKLAEAENLVDINTAKLNIQSKRLKHNAYNASNCWIYLMIIAVIVTFIYLTLFMRMFRKRIVTVKHSDSGLKSSYLSNALKNETVINATNVTTTTTITATKSTDYISLLLNYAHENHTDL